jgi:hypothetical protein
MRDFKALARRGSGNEPVVSIIVALVLGGRIDGTERWERRTEESRWREIYNIMLD